MKNIFLYFLFSYEALKKRNSISLFLDKILKHVDENNQNITLLKTNIKKQTEIPNINKDFKDTLTFDQNKKIENNDIFETSTKINIVNEDDITIMDNLNLINGNKTNDYDESKDKKSDLYIDNNNIDEQYTKITINTLKDLNNVNKNIDPRIETFNRYFKSLDKKINDDYLSCTEVEPYDKEDCICNNNFQKKSKEIEPMLVKVTSKFFPIAQHSELVYIKKDKNQKSKQNNIKKESKKKIKTDVDLKNLPKLKSLHSNAFINEKSFITTFNNENKLIKKEEVVLKKYCVKDQSLNNNDCRIFMVKEINNVDEQNKNSNVQNFKSMTTNELVEILKPLYYEN